MKINIFPKVLSVAALATFCASAYAGGGEYTGQFETALVANTEKTEKIVFTPTTADRWKEAGQFDSDAHLTLAQLMHPVTQDNSVRALLVEDGDDDPVIFIDQNGDNKFSPAEKYELKSDDNPYIWAATVTLPASDGPFTSSSMYIQYFRRVRMDKMTEGDRLVMQSSEVMARGLVDVNGKKVAVQYTLIDKKRVDAKNGWLGMDADGNGTVDMDNLSPEAARADNEVVIFRVGDVYLSTKKADVGKNQIVLREHDAKEYKRLELYFQKEFPDFTFTDFDGGKHKLSEFRGKYVLLDIWGFWCPPCRKELPYIKEAHKRFSNRNLEIVGLNTDEDYTVDSMKKSLKDNGMIWTQAKFESVVDFLRVGLRVNSFPTTFLISPEGKILSMSRQERDEPDLRGRELLESLDEILPKAK